MISHPNRSKSSPLRHVVYSLASHNTLNSAETAEAALAVARERLASGPYPAGDEFLVVFSTTSRNDLDRFDAGRWPADAIIVWRGANELAQTYRRS